MRAMRPGQALMEAIEKAGSQRKLAKRIGITHQAISQWRIVPAEWVVAIEQATGVERERMRPDLFVGMYRKGK